MTDTNEAINVESTSSRGWFPAAAARPAEMLLGLAFLASAVLKATDVNAFIVAIGQYGVVTDAPLQTAAALGTLALETLLGTALVLGLTPRKLTLGIATALLLVFSALIVYGWIAHGISDCGCMGPVKMGPGASLVKNAFLLVLCLLAALGFRARPAMGRAVLVKSVVVVLAALALAGYAYSRVQPVPRLYADFVFEEDGRSFDLGKGEYFVALLSTTCEHCMAAVEKLNPLAETPGFPPVVGLCDGDPQSLKEFRLITAPQFPTHSIGVRPFFTLIGKQPPRFVYVSDGRAVQVWDGEVPAPEAVAKARQTAGR